MVEHCGRFKDDRDRNPTYRYDASLFCPPHAPVAGALIQYLPIGTLSPAPGPDKVKAEYMIGYLGLDCSRLEGRRKAHARNLIHTLGSTPDSSMLQWAEDYYLKPDKNNRLKQFHSLSKAILKL